MHLHLANLYLDTLLEENSGKDIIALLEDGQASIRYGHCFLWMFEMED